MTWRSSTELPSFATLKCAHRQFLLGPSLHEAPRPRTEHEPRAINQPGVGSGPSRTSRGTSSADQAAVSFTTAKNASSDCPTSHFRTHVPQIRRDRAPVPFAGRQVWVPKVPHQEREDSFPDRRVGLSLEERAKQRDSAIFWRKSSNRNSPPNSRISRSRSSRSGSGTVLRQPFLRFAEFLGQPGFQKAGRCKACVEARLAHLLGYGLAARDRAPRRTPDRPPAPIEESSRTARATDAAMPFRSPQRLPRSVLLRSPVE